VNDRMMSLTYTCGKIFVVRPKNWTVSEVH
jgi:hypothetical protein